MRGEFLQHRAWGQSGSVHPQPMLQRHGQTVSQEGNQDVRVHPMLQLMIDRPNAQIALQTFERRFDLRQLHVAIPQHGRIFRHKVGAQQIVAVSQLGSFNLALSS